MSITSWLSEISQLLLAAVGSLLLAGPEAARLVALLCRRPSTADGNSRPTGSIDEQDDDDDGGDGRHSAATAAAQKRNWISLDSKRPATESR